MFKFLIVHKKEIIISLSTALIFYFFEPILSFLGNKIVSISIYLSKSFSDSFYKKLAQRDLNEMNEWGTTLISFIFLFIILFGLFYFHISKNKLRSKIKYFDNEVVADSEAKRKTEKTSELESSIKNRLNSIKKISFFININGIILICLVIFVYSQVKVRKDMILKFNNRIEALKAFVTQKEIDLLNSRWVLMKSVEDYNNLNSDLKKQLLHFNLTP